MLSQANILQDARPSQQQVEEKKAEPDEFIDSDGEMKSANGRSNSRLKQFGKDLINMLGFSGKAGEMADSGVKSNMNMR